jgi:16S rRNA (guanine966-N2)-methyltransferase
VREAVFNILLHGIPGFTLDGVRVLDLFAGTGALGIEALSRGAAYCLFVEDSAEPRAVIRRNIEALQLTGVSKVYRRDATNLGPANSRDRFGLVFLDPPYGQGLAERALEAAARGNWLCAGAVAVVEDRKGAETQLPPAYQRLDQRIWGDTGVLFARFQSAKIQTAS